MARDESKVWTLDQGIAGMIEMAAASVQMWKRAMEEGADRDAALLLVNNIISGMLAAAGKQSET